MSAMTKKEWMEYIEKTWDAAQKEAWTKKQWVGLTDDEVSEIIDREIGFNSCWGPEEAFARAVEQALKEKNHG